MFDLNKKIKVDTQLVLITIVLLLLFVIVIRHFFSKPTIKTNVKSWNGWYDWEDERMSNWPMKNMTYSLD